MGCAESKPMNDNHGPPPKSPVPVNVPVFLKGGNTGRFLSDRRNGSLGMSDNSQEWEKFYFKRAPGGANKFYILSSNNTYISDQQHGSVTVQNNKQAWEQFTVTETADGKIFITGHTGLTLSEQDGGRLEMKENQSGWEAFTVVRDEPAPAPSNKVGNLVTLDTPVFLKSGNTGRFLSDRHDGEVGMSDNCQAWEKFFFRRAGGNDKVYIEADSGVVLSDQTNGRMATSGNRQAWEEFTIGETADGKIFIVGHTGMSLSEQGGGQLKMVGNQSGWEAWTIVPDN